MGEKDFSHRSLGDDAALWFVPPAVFQRVRDASLDATIRVPLLADLCRINTLYMIMRAGSGHIGSSFSSMDLITWLWTQELMNPNSGDAGSDVYFSSKGHDAPALYSLLIALEKLDFSLVHKLRQIDGLPGHPDVGTPFIATNTGSLGMGISKAYGMVRANRFRGQRGRVFVMTGDGELQEGQIWESLQPVANERLAEIVVIVDHNKYQSDTLVSAVSDLGPIEAKFKAFGWEVQRGDGHDPTAIRRALAHFATVNDRPKVFIADTIKGRGVSFMEGLACGDQTYQFHAGAPSLKDYLAATAELLDRVNDRMAALGQLVVTLESGPLPVRVTPTRPEKIVLAYGDELLAMARERPEIVVLDADLLTDCGIEAFREELPDRFIECGIAEQHMVSAAGGLALRGMLPVVHSFACFLTTRANEHIYNNATEQRKIIYVGTLAGLVPGGPGHSHQSVRDISAIGAVPGLVAFEPCSEREARLAIRWAVEENPESTYLRFVNIPLDLPVLAPGALSAVLWSRCHAETGCGCCDRRIRHGASRQCISRSGGVGCRGHLRRGDRPSLAQSHRRRLGGAGARSLSGHRDARQSLSRVRSGNDDCRLARAHRRARRRDAHRPHQHSRLWQQCRCVEASRAGRRINCARSPTVDDGRP